MAISCCMMGSSQVVWLLIAWLSSSAASDMLGRTYLRPCNGSTIEMAAVLGRTLMIYLIVAVCLRLANRQGRVAGDATLRCLARAPGSPM